MKTMAISAFKAHALRVVAQVAQTREGLVITRRGRPLARVLPYQPAAKTSRPGRLASALVFEKDILSPLGAASWEAGR